MLSCISYAVTVINNNVFIAQRSERDRNDAAAGNRPLEFLMNSVRQLLHARMLEHLVLQEMRRTTICPNIASVMVAPGEGDGNWIVQTYDPGPHKSEDCNRTFSIILPDLMTRYGLARD
jgi:hypothetical protein